MLALEEFKKKKSILYSALSFRKKKVYTLFSIEF